ncbi:unnamed protein product, partial [Angiostrongylus costaricensis]|uniref:Myb-like DNA-binding domain protein n=1 Tax=Angiostrongylus costaricensis TaxID=334426 RepID=A0A158PJ80_ANGCS
LKSIRDRRKYISFDSFLLIRLRSPRFVEHVGVQPRGIHPYTPPPILSPMRNGSGLFWQIAKNLGHPAQVSFKKLSSLHFHSKKSFSSVRFMHNKALRKISWASTSSSTNSIQSELCKNFRIVEDLLKTFSVNIQWIRMKGLQIHNSELEAIEDRDEIIFSPDVLSDIENDQIEAFELLACSQAIPRPGRNKELALHLLMENKGNIEAAVADLLRSDTLDWEQYQIIYGSHYLDSVNWTPEEVNAFQDAIYKTEKDFHQVAQELPSKTVRECVEFYYTWKKACPDDYRKLRNLRRKRQLLELNLQQVKGHPFLYISPPAVAVSPLREVPPLLSSSSSISHALLGLRQSPPLKDLSGLQRNYQPSAPRTQFSSTSGTKKGAQPSADGFFHCRLCDKCFEKVKSLNAHMKSHAMKARAEAEAKAQVDAQLAATQSNSVITKYPFLSTKP